MDTEQVPRGKVLEMGIALPQASPPICSITVSTATHHRWWSKNKPDQKIPCHAQNLVKRGENTIAPGCRHPQGGLGVRGRYDDAFGTHQFNIPPLSVIGWSGGPGGGPPNSGNLFNWRAPNPIADVALLQPRKIKRGTRQVINHDEYFVRSSGRHRTLHGSK